MNQIVSLDKHAWTDAFLEDVNRLRNIPESVLATFRRIPELDLTTLPFQIGNNAINANERVLFKEVSKLYGNTSSSRLVREIHAAIKEMTVLYHEERRERQERAATQEYLASQGASDGRLPWRTDAGLVVVKGPMSVSGAVPTNLLRAGDVLIPTTGKANWRGSGCFTIRSRALRNNRRKWRQRIASQRSGVAR